MRRNRIKKGKKGTHEKPAIAAAEPVSVNSNCVIISTSGELKWHYPEPAVIGGGRPTAKAPTAKCAPAPTSGAAVAEAVGPSTSAKKKTYSGKRAAARKVRSRKRRISANPSAERLKKVEWARQDFRHEGSTKCAEQTKRQHPSEAPGPTAKKSKILPTVSFADMIRNRVLLGVVDWGNPDGLIPKRMWKKVEGAILLKGLELMESEPGPPPSCIDAGWYQGVKIIACEDVRSVNLYKKAVAQLDEVYEGANLVALDWCDVPIRPRARIWFPSAVKKPSKILFLLQHCNPHLPTRDWKVAKVEEHEGNTNQAVVILNKESVAPIEAANGHLSFGFMEINIKLYKGDLHSRNPAVQDIADEIEAPGTEDDEPSDDEKPTFRGVTHAGVVNTPADKPRPL